MHLPVMKLSLVLPLVLSSFRAHATPTLLLSRDSDADIQTLVNLRVEGSSKTIFEGQVSTDGHNVKTPSGGTHACDGLNNNANKAVGATALNALDTAANTPGKNFTFDGTFSKKSDDFSITKIESDKVSSSKSWNLLINFEHVDSGPCQQEVQVGDKILWAYGAKNVSVFLELSGPNTASKGETQTFTVTDGKTGKAVEGAEIVGLDTDTKGTVTIAFTSTGVHTLKATKTDTVRSNELLVLVE